MERVSIKPWTSDVLRKHPGYYRVETDGSEQKKIEQVLGDVVFGQDAAIKSVARAMLRGEAGMSDPNRPAFSAFFAGPFGTGKSEMGLAIAHYICPKNPESVYLRIPCGSYQSEHDVQNLIGAPTSYIGYGDSPEITPDFLHQGRTVVVFDEIEKAHETLQKAQLEILASARLVVPIKNDLSKDVERRVLNFNQCSVILTSNLGAGEMKDAQEGKHMGFTKTGTTLDIDRVGQRAIEDYFKFRPEFINRLDAVVIFRHLTDPVLRRILDKFIYQTNCDMRFANPFDLTQEAKDFVIRQSNPKLGGRELKRKLEELVLTPASEAKIKLSEGQSFVADLNHNGKVSIWASRIQDASSSSNTEYERKKQIALDKYIRKYDRKHGR